MKLLSFIDEANLWVPVEVELELWPGLPEIHFLGRPDQNLRESAKRIKSAIRSQGFEFPVAQQILVNLRPSYLKKSSRGIELAVAAAFLMETGQIPKWIGDSRTFFYGELSLTGEVNAPLGLGGGSFPDGTVLITGQGAQAMPLAFREAKNLRELPEPRLCEANWVPPRWEPPEAILDLEIPRKWARFLGVVALGEHSILLAGAAGSGKTTAGRILHALLPGPSAAEAWDLWRASFERGEELGASAWRPLIQPHHTIPTLSLLGGGVDVNGGELARADRGLLLLDEFFEFSPVAIESLREPLEQRKMRVSRGSRVREYPLRSQVVATTNLCPCGEYRPGHGRQKSCRFTLGKCNSYAQKITGPLLDRFEILAFTKVSDALEPRVRVGDLRAEVEAKRIRRQRVRGVHQEEISHIQGRTDPFFLKDWQQRNLSERRRRATLKVAQSLCDWDEKDKITGSHLEESLAWTVHPFEQVRRWDLRSV